MSKASSLINEVALGSLDPRMKFKTWLSLASSTLKMKMDPGALDKLADLAQQPAMRPFVDALATMDPLDRKSAKQVFKLLQKKVPAAFIGYGASWQP